MESMAPVLAATGTVTLTRDQVAQLARDAIDLYREDLERHGQTFDFATEDAERATFLAVAEVVEGTFLRQGFLWVPRRRGVP